MMQLESADAGCNPPRCARGRALSVKVYFPSDCSSRESFNSAATQMINAGPKQNNTPIGITQILMNLSITSSKYSRFKAVAQLLIRMPIVSVRVREWYEVAASFLGQFPE